MTEYLDELKRDYMLRIKKFLVPALISASKHLKPVTVLSKVWTEFRALADDEMWAVRKVCIEQAGDMVKCLPAKETAKIKEVVEFFKRCLADANNWVKSQALL